MPDNNNMNFGVDLLPVSDNTYYLGKTGTTNKRWKIYASEINGKNITGSNIATVSEVNSSRVEIVRLNSGS